MNHIIHLKKHRHQAQINPRIIVIIPHLFTFFQKRYLIPHSRYNKGSYPYYHNHRNFHKQIHNFLSYLFPISKHQFTIFIYIRYMQYQTQYNRINNSNSMFRKLHHSNLPNLRKHIRKHKQAYINNF